VRRPEPPSGATLWRRSAFEVITSDVVARQTRGPEPPAEWAAPLRQLLRAARQPREGPAWWSPTSAYFGNVETRTDPSTYSWDGMKRLGRRDRPLVFFQITFAGFGHFESQGQPPRALPPGTAFFAVVPSRHRYYLPASSPGWTFAWIGVYHPYVLRRIAQQVAKTGPVLALDPAGALTATALRLVRGAFQKDFRDRFEVEQTLFEFLFGYERQAEQSRDPGRDREHLLAWVRARVLAAPRRTLDVTDIAEERGMTRSHFSHDFHARTGLTPAHYMTDVRVQEAARRLLESRAPLKQIATEWGFSSANHFGKVFRRYFHTSPAAYRRAFGGA